MKFQLVTSNLVFSASRRFGQFRSYSQGKFPKSVRIVEVGPRDGLQNEKQVKYLSHNWTIMSADLIMFSNRSCQRRLRLISSKSWPSPD